MKNRNDDRSRIEVGSRCVLSPALHFLHVRGKYICGDSIRRSALIGHFLLRVSSVWSALVTRDYTQRPSVVHGSVRWEKITDWALAYHRGAGAWRFIAGPFLFIRRSTRPKTKENYALQSEIHIYIYIYIVIWNTMPATDFLHHKHFSSPPSLNSSAMWTESSDDFTSLSYFRFRRFRPDWFGALLTKIVGRRCGRDDDPRSFADWLVNSGFRSSNSFPRT